MEKIMIAAIQITTIENDTFVMTGVRHADIWEDIHRMRAHIKMRRKTEGFLTNTNRFVNRVEAKKIAVAANQLIVPEKETFTELYSEDIY